MGWLNFLKGRTETEDKSKTISFDEANALIENELKKRDNEILLIKNSINIKTGKFISDLEEQIKIFKNITFEERKEDEKVKFMVLENLHSYINDISKLANNLEKIDYETDVGFIFRRINLEIGMFSKNSQRKLAKAAILSGNKLARSEEIIKIFYKDIKEIAEGNKKIIKKGEGIKKLNDLKHSLLELNKIHDEISKEADNLKNENETMKNEKNEKEKELMFFKKSRDYISFIDEKSKLKEDIERLKEDAKLLKNKIDFKSLLNNFHEIEMARELIKSYRDDFLKALDEDKGFDIIELLGQNQKSLHDEIKDISKRSVSLKESGENVIERKLNELERSIKKNDFEILNISNKIDVENKKLEKFNENKILLQNEIKAVMDNILDGVRIA